MAASDLETTADVPTDGGGSRRRGRASLLAAARVLLSVAVIWLLWDLARLVGVLPTSQVPAAGTIVSTLLRDLGNGDLLTPLGQTVVAFLVGLSAAVVIGVPLGFLVGRSGVADDSLGLTLDLLRPVPAVALVPVAVVVLGLGLMMQVVLVAFAALWPIVFNTRYGARNVDTVLVDAGRLAGLGRWGCIVRVMLPAALPSIMTGVRLAAAIAVVLTVVTELVASGTGIGYFVSTNQQQGVLDAAFAGVLLAALVGTLVNALVRTLERRAIGWHLERQALL